MANPQIENGFTRLANELQDAFIKFKITKRQRNILDLIIRLSYGCQKKVAFIPALKYFAAFGVSKQNIRTELEKLEAARVITWDRARCFFALNKNYDEWQLEPESQFDEQSLKDLIALQLYPSYSPQVRKKRTQKEKEVRKKRTNIIEGSQKANSIVRKRRTHKFAKSEPRKLAKPRQDWAGGNSKDSIKDNNKNNSFIDIAAAKNNTAERKNQEQINQIYDFFEQNIKTQGLTPYHYERLHGWIDDHSPELLLHVFKHSLDATRSNGSSPLVFIDKILLRARQKGITTVEQFIAAEEQREREKQARRQEKRSTRTEVLPQWFIEEKEREEKERQQRQQQEQSEEHLQSEAARLKAEIEAEELEKKRRELEHRIKTRHTRRAQEPKEATQ